MRKSVALCLAVCIIAGSLGMCAAAEEAQTEAWDVIYSPYEEIVDNYVTALTENWPAETLTENNMCYMFIMDYSLENNGFYFEDINGDGTVELMTGCIDESSPAIIYDLYTLDPEGQPVHVFSSQGRGMYYLCENNMIYNENYHGAGCCANTYYWLVGSELSMVESAYYDCYVGDEPYFYSDEGVGEEFYVQSSQKEYEAVIASHPCRTLSFTPFSKAAAEPAAEAPKPKQTEAYSDILQKYAEGIKAGWDCDTFTENGICYLAGSFSSLDEAGYYLTDLDQDGVNELFVGPIGYSDFYELYTLVEERATLVIMGGVRESFYLCTDNTIANAGSGSALTSSWCYYDYSGTKLKLKEAVICDGYYDEQNPWFYSTAMTSQDYSQPITMEEADAIRAKYEYADIPYIPLSALTWEGSENMEEVQEDYLLPESDSRYLTENDIVSMTAAEIQKAINEIYARHGRVFTSADNDAFFRAKSWYQPVEGKTDEMIRTEFNQYETYNVNFLAKYL